MISFYFFVSSSLISVYQIGFVPIGVRFHTTEDIENQLGDYFSTSFCKFRKLWRFVSTLSFILYKGSLVALCFEQVNALVTTFFCT